MSVLAIIPARGGSKSIPQKNIKPLAGKPLIAWSIEAALAAPSVNRVVVSTDDDDIATVARQFGAEVVMRPPELATDTASSESALLHVLDTLAVQNGYNPCVLAFIQCTSPLTLSADINGTVNLVLQEGYDTAVTMTPFHYFLWEDAEGSMIGVNHEATRRLMRQQRKPQYKEVGAVYAMDAAQFRQRQFRFFGRIGRYLIPASRAFEIDEPDDWVIAENILHSRPRNQILPSTLARVQAVVTDFDGVMTNNQVTVTQDGTESVVCNRSDGWGINLLKQTGILVACISTETNPVVAARCRKLGIPYWQGEKNKLTTLQAFLAQSNLEAQDCLYIGNDTNDAACLAYAGTAVVPQDAAAEVLPLADWQTDTVGGAGVLREVARAIIQARS
ncbi:MAG: acylneuraminate cytidylyltransferase [Anaerolineales bacterium]|nr:acylneuraminate cytidylyltransferase [Anaerolineales bacterium]MCB8989449.1 acylneuraminate cytidylyltransferase [Ardenticatenaceae bacterium]MCB9005013.1 acylneuraminate cytidylyltransferase [Ardenticatenaceae bacterium]